MVRNIVIVLILAVIGVPAWQVGMIKLERKNVGQVVQQQANRIKKHSREDLIRKDLTKELELLGLPTQFQMERTEQNKMKITYNYMASASVFGKTYYEVAETFEKVTEDGAFD
jgi:Tfp pilus assembly protein PilE